MSPIHGTSAQEERKRELSLEGRAGDGRKGGERGRMVPGLEETTLARSWKCGKAWFVFEIISVPVYESISLETGSGVK